MESTSTCSSAVDKSSSLIDEDILKTSDIRAPDPGSMSRYEHLMSVDSSYPPLDLVIHLTELYFENINSQTYSFLHRPTFMPRLERREVSPLLVYSICALSARFSKHPDLHDGNSDRPLYLAGERFLGHARHLLSLEFDQPTLETVQAVICMVQHEFFRSHGGRSMIYMAMAFPMALQLGLNREPSKSLPWVEQESRRRTFWSLVVLDRLGHTTPLYSLQLDEKHFLNLALPCQAHRFIGNIVTHTPSLSTPPEIANSSRYDVRGIFAYHIEGTLLWNRATVFSMKCGRNTPVDIKEYLDISEGIESFEKTIPETFRYSYSRLEELAAMRRMGHYIHVHCELQATKFLLHKNLCYEDVSVTENLSAEELKKHREKAMYQVTSAANFLSEMLIDMAKIGDNIPTAPLVGYCVFLVSSVHIALSFSPDKAKALRAKQYLAVNLKFLVDLREYWYIVGVWCVILKDRYSAAMARHQPCLTSNSENPSENNENKQENGNGTDHFEEINQNACYLSRPGTPPPYLPDEYLNPSELPQEAPPTPPYSLSHGSPGSKNLSDKSTPTSHYLDDSTGLDWLVHVEGNKDFVEFEINNNPPSKTFDIEKENAILDHILMAVNEKPVLH